VKTLVVGVLLAQATFAPSPAPTGSPLQEIGHTTSAAACAQLRDVVRPALEGVLRNDEAIDAGSRLLARLEADSTGSTLGDASPGMDVDRRHLARAATALVRNLRVLRALVVRLPHDSPIGTSLASVVALQTKALDTLEGVVDTEDLGEMQREFPKGSGPVEYESPSYLSGAGLPKSPRDAGLPVARAPGDLGLDPVSLSSNNLRGHTAYATILSWLSVQRTQIDAAEAVEAKDVFVAVDACGGKSPVPAR